ncbi:MAG: class I SAM-dependent methyltransferase [Flaviramulus sp.]|nr:class I SAM-dependent methyltransferase [Flaviramulus sp.]NNC50955.1 class I SAM-dependent methyltransferase [Flaviramulus sp.]
MYYQAVQYIKFLFKSSNHHGVHSPFVYNLVSKCFYDRNNYSDYKAIVNYKKALLNNNRKISIKDLGVGSQVMRQTERTVCNIANTAGTTNKRAKLLYRLSIYFKPKNVLELGTSLGIATHALALANPNANITTIEGCPNTFEFSVNNLDSYNLKNIKPINGNFNNEIEKLKSIQYDLIFFDGNHQKKATLNYFETLLKTANNNSIFIFDDIYWSKNMTKAWEIIKKHPKVTVTIDTFYWGFVFFRTEQVKQHFTIRV